MSNKNEPMANNSTQVHTTIDYSLFKSIDGNRTKNTIHVQRLKKSMQEKYLFTTILVNEKYEVIDGQHRLDVIKELKLPLNYIVCKGYGLNEVHVLNQNSKNWTSADYLDGYCKLGYKDYLVFKEFIDRHEINTQIAMYLLTGYDNGDMIKSFNAGNFKIKDLNDAEKIMNQLHLIKPFYENYKRRWFVYAIVKLLKNENFEFIDLLQKLKIQPTILQDCNDVKQYVTLLEEIYNYRRRDKVNLRF